jgi:N-acetylneuraminic acid mutarotase
VTVTDNHGSLWLFGGEGYDASGNFGYLNDLWKFDPSSSEWTWISGSSTISSAGIDGVYGQKGVAASGNVPGGRWNAVGWVDRSGNIWLLGGEGLDSNGLYGDLNDLWKFNPASEEWTWISGSQTLPANYKGQPGVYGSLGTPAAANIPGGRWGASSWTDAQGHFWLFGGEGSDELGSVIQGNTIWEGQLNDLWEFDPSTTEWTWMAGSKDLPSDGAYAPSQYGSQGVSASGNVPGGRYTAASWMDSNGKLWLFGGVAAAANGLSGDLNDLWEFDPSTMQWTWISGGNTLPCSGACGSPASYGTLGVSSSANVPGGRYSSSWWTDANGNLWLFGGTGVDATDHYGRLNDLWNFDTTTQEWTWIGGSNLVSQGGTYGTKGTPSSQNLPGSRNSAASWTDGSGNFWLFGGLGTYTGGNYGTLGDLLEYKMPVSPAAAPTFNPAAGTYNAAQIVTISDATANATIYYTTNGTTPTTSSTVYSGAITVSSTETIEAIAVASGYSASAVASASYTIIPPAATPVFTPPAGSYTSVQSVTITDATSGTAIYYTTDGTIPTTSSAVYGGPISISTSETIEAIAIASGYAASAVASAAYAINLPPPSFSFSSGAPSLTISSGGKGSVTLTVTQQNGFSSAVSFACSGLPAGASCAFNPATVTPAGSVVSTTLTISVAAKTATLQHEGWPHWPATALALTGLVFVRKKNRRSASLLALMVLATGIGVVTACGGGSGGSVTPTPTPTTSTVTVTATSGTLQQSVNLSLTVN